MSDNPSFVLRGVEDLTYEQRTIPEIKDHEVLVAVKKTGMYILYIVRLFV